MTYDPRGPDEMTAEMRAIIERFIAKAKQMPTDAPELEPPPTLSAVEVRLGWYLPKRHTNDTFDNFRPVTPSQRAALDATREWVAAVQRGDGGALALTGGVGTGKCLAVGTPVLMHDGSIRNVEDVRTGDTVMGPDSLPRRVLGTTRGRAEMYRVTPVKGSPYVVNGDHVLSLVMSGGKGRFSPGDVVNISVRDYLAMSKSFKAEAKGYRAGVDFPAQPVGDLNPYLLGLWLGDGDSDRPVITTPDKEIEEYIYAVADSLGITVSRRNNGGAADSFRIGANGSCVVMNPITTALRHYNLLKAKHIPRAYLINSREVRLAVLAGLIDTDGHIASGGCDIITKYDDLARDILFLCRSLGLAAYSKIKMAYAANTKAQTVRPYHRIYISGDLSVIPTRVERKKATPRLQSKSVLRTGIKVEAIGPGEYAGFAVDGDHLFLLGDFTVTHNSHLMYAACRALNEAGIHAAAAGWYDLADTFRQAKRGSDEDVTEARLIKARFLGAAALCIDEIRPTSGTDYDTTELSQLMTRAYREQQGVIVTSNHADEKLARIVGLAAASRLTQVTVVGPDHRQRRGAA